MACIAIAGVEFNRLTSWSRPASLPSDYGLPPYRPPSTVLSYTAKPSPANLTTHQSSLRPATYLPSSKHFSRSSIYRNYPQCCYFMYSVHCTPFIYLLFAVEGPSNLRKMAKTLSMCYISTAEDAEAHECAMLLSKLKVSEFEIREIFSAPRVYENQTLVFTVFIQYVCSMYTTYSMYVCILFIQSYR